MSLYPEILIRGQNGECISIRRLGVHNCEGWFGAEIEVRCDGWRGKFTASLMQGELSRFARELRILHEKLIGKAVFSPMEPNLELTFVGDGKGHFEVEGIARNNFHSGVMLSFCLELDQTYLPEIVKGLFAADP